MKPVEPLAEIVPEVVSVWGDPVCNCSFRGSHYKPPLVFQVYVMEKLVNSNVRDAVSWVLI
jgi:hypothetical protein